MNELIQKIGIGTVQFGIPYGISNITGQTSKTEVAQILEIARERKIEIIDTASAYGDAERVLGENNLSRFRVVSKFIPPDEGRTITSQLKQSLKSLGVASLYGYLAHRPNHLVDNLSVWEELQALRSNGIVKKIGYSLNRPEELEKLLDKGAIPDIIQVPYNYFDRRFENLMVSLKEDGCEVHSRSVFLQGLFFMDIEQLDHYFSELIPLIKNLQININDLAGALLKFALQKPFIDAVIMGIENSRQFSQNLNSIKNAGLLPELNQNISESILIPSNWPT